MSTHVAAWLERGPLRGFLEAAPDAIVVVDKQGGIAAVNRLTEKMFGYARDELLGKPVELLVPERYRSKHVHDRSGYSAEPHTRPMGGGRELSGLRKDGSEFPVEISLSPLDTEKGTLVISIVRDTTQRRQAEAKFRGLLESAPDGIVVVDTSGCIVIVNTQAEKLFGYNRSELLNQPIEILLPDRFKESHLPQRDAYFSNPKTRPMGAGRALTGRKKNGSEFPVEISLSPLETEHGMLVTSIIRDISERRLAEEKIQASLREKEVLLKEIHHRVKNNLQVTSSLLKLQSNYIQDKQARDMFIESQGRIRSMALIHEKLYQSNDLSRINFLDYSKTLASLLFRSYGEVSTRIELEVGGTNTYLSIDSAVPCGLILNELLSNCLKHAFPGGRPGRIRVRVNSESDQTFLLSVRDNGVGLPIHTRADKTESLGLELVKTLVDQLRGNLTTLQESGTEFQIRFGIGAPPPDSES